MFYEEEFYFETFLVGEKIFYGGKLDFLSCLENNLKLHLKKQVFFN